MPLRIIDYWVRLYRLYRLPITQVVVLLLPPAVGTPIETVFEVESTCHRYRVLCLWEEDPETLLSDPALLPLATLAATTSPATLLQRVATQVNQIAPDQRQTISAYTQILAGLKYEKGLIRQLFQEEMMRDSVIYQEVLAAGRQEGRQEGEQSMILRLLTRRLGVVPAPLRSRILSLSIEQLESFGDALLEFRTLSDIETWFNSLS